MSAIDNVKVAFLLPCPLVLSGSYICRITATALIGNSYKLGLCSIFKTKLADSPNRLSRLIHKLALSRWVFIEEGKIPYTPNATCLFKKFMAPSISRYDVILPYANLP